MKTSGILGLGLLVVLGLVALAHAGQQFQTDYMTDKCNTSLGTRIGGRLETSSSLSYDSLMNCHVTVTAPTGKMVMMFFWRFEVEDKLAGTCVDVFNVHDGNSRGAPLVNSEPLCGIWSPTDGLSNMTSSQDDVTFTFETDNTAVYRGFEIIYVAYTWAPCDSDRFACNNSLCIDPNLRCDDVTQCGDGSDEEGCEDEETEDDNKFPWALVIGCSVAGLILLLICVIGNYKAYQYYKWKGWLARNSFKRYPWLHSDDIYEYPVTDKYSKYEIGYKGRREPDVSPYFANGPEVVRADESGRYLDED